ncbi:hypothetical protein GCM10023116_38580 [Kistimonas scapharcae]|uniref:OTU domain-containing protein n=1 Tax=Kistimonas scapharcae TaxID=1036133 RepID=A0ABP8V7P6_9GAMM
MPRNISDVLSSSIETIEKWTAVEDKKKWCSLDMQKGKTPDGRRVYKLVEVEGFFSYLISHIKCFLRASDYKKSMEAVLHAPDIDKSIKKRYIQYVNSGVIPFVKNIPYQKTLPAISERQEERGKINFSTGTMVDSDYETASEISGVSESFDVGDLDSLSGEPGGITDDEGYADEPARSAHTIVDNSHARPEVDASRLAREYSSENEAGGSVDVDDEGVDPETQRALALSRETAITDQARRDIREANDIEEAVRRSNDTFLEESDPDLAQVLALSREALKSDEAKRQALEQKAIEDAIHRSMAPHAVPDEDSDDGLAKAIAASKNAAREDQAKRARQEQRAESIVNKYDREFVQTVRNGDCFYDGVSKVRGHSNIMELRNRSYQEGERCLEGNGKLHFDTEIAFLLEEQIELLKQQYNYAEQLDVRLMASTENCRIVICDLSEKVTCIAGPQGELEEYPATSLDDVMQQYPEAELFVLATADNHYMAGRRQ